MMSALVVFGSGASATRADVILYVNSDYTGGYTFNLTVKNLGDYEDSYQTTCEGENKLGIPIKYPCKKTIRMNDNMRAIEITGDEVVEIYEHSNFGGRHVRYRGPTKDVFPAWLWDRASSIAVYR
jgi:hypothetical protein